MSPAAGALLRMFNTLCITPVRISLEMLVYLGLLSPSRFPTAPAGGWHGQSSFQQLASQASSNPNNLALWKRRELEGLCPSPISLGVNRQQSCYRAIAWLTQQTQTTRPEHSTAPTATQALEDAPAPLQSLTRGLGMPNPTANSSALTQLLSATTWTAL